MIARILLVSACLAAGCAEKSNQSLICQPVAGQDRLNLNRITGRWYVEEASIGTTEVEVDIARCMDIFNTNDTSVLHFQYYHGTGPKQYKVSNITGKVVGTSQWIQDDYSSEKLEYSPDGNTITITNCNIDRFSLVFDGNITFDLVDYSAAVMSLNRSDCPSLIEAAAICKSEFQGAHCNSASRFNVFVPYSVLALLLLARGL